MSEPIADFRGQYAFLSNFFPISIEMDGAEYPTIEHAFQAAKHWILIFDVASAMLDLPVRQNK